jgi:hypothetical protein
MHANELVRVKMGVSHLGSLYVYTTISMLQARSVLATKVVSNNLA